MIISNTPNELSFLKYPIHKDIIPGSGPLGRNIYLALNFSKQEQCLVLACDMPFVTKDIIKFLIHEGTRSDIIAT